MVEVTESQRKDLIYSMKKLTNMEDMKVQVTTNTAKEQLAYFKLHDE